jgi:hypothetical protein
MVGDDDNFYSRQIGFQVSQLLADKDRGGAGGTRYGVSLHIV